MRSKKIIILFILCLLLLPGCSRNDLAIKVGFIYPGSSADQGINQMQEEACNNLVDYFNGKVQTISKSAITSENIESVIYDMVNSGVSIIFISSNQFDEQVTRAAHAYENVDFVIYNGNVDMPNIKNYYARDYEADYLSGILAGASTKSNKIGYLAPSDNSQNKKNINAFALGVLKSNPEATIELIYLGDNPSASRINGAVNRIATDGCDILASCFMDNQALIQASNMGLKVIGTSPSGIDSTDNYLTSRELNLTDFYITEVNSVLNGTFDNSAYTGTVYDNFVGLDDYTYNVSNDAKKLTDSTIKSIKDGNLAVFTGPFSDTNGNVRAQENQVLSEADIKNMDYLLSNIKVLT